MGDLAGKIAVVTGGGSGIGRACALALAKKDVVVIVGDIDASGAAQTCEMIAADGGTAHFKLLDVADEQSWTAFMAAAAKDFGALHILVNNAAICISKPLLEMTFESWRRQMAINLDGMFLGTKAALPLITASGGGSVINMSSVAGIRGVAGMAGYCASKGGVRMFTKAVALECAKARNNIRVNSVHPGSIETPIWLKLGNDGVMPDSGDRRNSDAMDEIRAAGAAVTPLGHSGMPSDIACAVVFLASDNARFITGTELVVDGGVMAG